MTAISSDEFAWDIERLNAIGIALSAQRDPQLLLEMILLAAKDFTAADGGTMYLVHEERELRFTIIRTDSLGLQLGGSKAGEIPFPPIPLYLSDGHPNLHNVAARAVLDNRTITIPDAYDCSGYDFSGTRAFDQANAYRSQSFLTVPMTNHEGEIVGVLQLINARDRQRRCTIPFTNTHQSLAESLASQAAIALSRNQLIDEMGELFEALIQLIAKAIDDKSPHTGGHCRRVPELTMLIAEACDRHAQGELADFHMDEAARYELRIAAWLHDCGKLTTPDWIMEKDRKLTALHDRIELIRLRFQILRRDAALARQQHANDDAAAEQRYRERLTELDRDLAFIERCNRGGEWLDDASLARLDALAECGYDDAGIWQPLLTADELRNLRVRKGTLNDDERRTIQGHMDATLAMLENLPYPKHLRRVPEFAGGHHEHMDGSGYPRGLRREDMSIPARIMGVADIFEALTASDRPYKPGMPLSQALSILAEMACSGHIDPDIFAVFLRQRAYEHYADRFLDERQRDQVDIDALLARCAQALR